MSDAARERLDGLRRDLVQRIREVFPETGRTYSADEVVPRGRYDDDYVRDAFADRTWTSFSPHELWGCSSALNFMETAPLVTFLPAFMLAVIEDVEGSDVLADRMADLCASDAEDPSRLPGLTDAQRAALQQFAQYVDAWFRIH